MQPFANYFWKGADRNWLLFGQGYLPIFVKIARENDAAFSSPRLIQSNFGPQTIISIET